MRAVKRICGWCGKFMGYKTGKFPKGAEATHGICEDCRRKLRAEVTFQKKQS